MTAPQGFINRIWLIDLDTAQRFLKFFKEPEKGVKDTNRKWSPLLVNEYAFEMLSGRWGFSNEGMGFTGFIEDGTADGIDGEHRLRALIQACTNGAVMGSAGLRPNPGFSFEVMVSEGLDPQARKITNIGKRRTASDFMAMRGETNTNVLASVIALSYAFDQEPPNTPFLQDRWTGSKMSPILRDQYLDANPGLPEAIHEGARAGKVMNRSSAAVGVYQALKAGIERELVEEFIDSLASGVGLDHREHPILRLRDGIANARRARRMLNREEQLALFIKAFNKWRNGQSVGTLVFKTKPSSDGASAEVFPRFQV